MDQDKTLSPDAAIQQPTHDAFVALWEAANNHCVCLCGQYLDGDYTGDDMPPPPDAAGILQAVTAYLKEMV